MVGDDYYNSDCYISKSFTTMPMNSFQPPEIIINNSDDDTDDGNDKRRKRCSGQE